MLYTTQLMFLTCQRKTSFNLLDVLCCKFNKMLPKIQLFCVVIVVVGVWLWFTSWWWRRIERIECLKVGMKSLKMKMRQQKTNLSKFSPIEVEKLSSLSFVVSSLHEITQNYFPHFLSSSIESIVFSLSFIPLFP